MYLLVSVIILTVIWFHGLQRWTKHAKMVNHFPGPRFVPVLGNVLEWSSALEQMFRMPRNYSARFRTTYRLWLGMIGSVNIFNPHDAEALMSGMKHIKKSFIYDFFYRWLATGLLTSTGRKWQNRRKILTPSFHFNILQSFVEVFGDHCEKLVEELKRECEKPQTDVVPYIARHTLNIICETAMGTKLDMCEKRDRAYIDALYGFPWLYSDLVYNMTWTAWRERRYVRTLHEFTTRVIRRREAALSAGRGVGGEEATGRGRARLAMLDLLIDCKRRTALIDDDGIREEVDTFMFEGHDTTAMALSFALMLLANHGSAQERIWEECRGIFGGSDRRATHEDLQLMEYTGRFVKESLRLYPSVPFISRVLADDLALSNGVAPAGCMANVHIYDLHRNPQVYPDPDRFDPDRFLPENVATRHPFSYIPFSAGPRNCIGQKFAMLELKSILSIVVRNYLLKAIDKPEHMVLTEDMVLRNKLPIYVKFIQRAQTKHL